MAIITKASAKLYFLTGAFPTQTQFGDTIDTYLGLGEAGNQTVQGPLTFTSNVIASGDILAAQGRVTASAATITSKLSARGGLNTTILSANSINITGDVLAATGRVTASAATISNKVSATQVYASTVTVSGSNITAVKGTTAIIASVSGNMTSGHIATWNANNNLVDGGAAPTQIMTALGIGSIVLMRQASGVTATAGQSYAASGLAVACLQATNTATTADTQDTGDSITGTWQALSTSNKGGGNFAYTLFQRIA